MATRGKPAVEWDCFYKTARWPAAAQVAADAASALQVLPGPRLNSIHFNALWSTA